MAQELSDTSEGCKTVRDVWAVFAVGQLKDDMVSLSFQDVFPSKAVAEASGLLRWKANYADARPDETPLVVAKGPYLKEIPL